MTLVETSVSVGIISFIIGFVAYLVFMASINAYNVHDQVLAQTSAATASEQITSLLREASHYALCSGDTIPFNTETTFTRIQFMLPPRESSWGTQTTSVLCWDPGDSSARPPKPPSVCYYADAGPGGTIPTVRPTRRFSNIAGLTIKYESEFRLQVSVNYQYNGFALLRARPQRPMVGQFTTDVIAKNRFLPFGKTTAYADNYDASVTTSVIHL